MGTVTTEDKGRDHVYIRVDDKWVASCLPAYKERFVAAAQDDNHSPSAIEPTLNGAHPSQPAPTGTPRTDAAEKEVLQRYLHYKPDPTKRDLVRAMDEAQVGWRLARTLERELSAAPQPGAQQPVAEVNPIAFSVLKTALGNAAACLGDALAGYNAPGRRGCFQERRPNVRRSGRKGHRRG